MELNSLENDFIIVINDIKDLIKKARYKTVIAINSEMLMAYYQIGKKIVEEEQKGKERAEYGEKLLENLSKELNKEFGKGFSVDNLERMRRFYLIYQNSATVLRNSQSIKNQIYQSVTDELKKQETIPLELITNKISQTVSGQFHKKRESVTPELLNTNNTKTFSGEFYKLTWTHYCELIKIEDEVKRKYFEKYAIQENLSVRDLKRQIYSLHYERLLMSKDKKGLIEYEKKKNIPSTPEEIIKDPYILEFLNLDEKHQYNEKDIENKILNELQKFLLELGQGFTFVARQKRFTIDNDHFYIDLLFYNIHLRCYVIIELKTGKFKHEYAGQMNFYINYVKKELNKKTDNEPIAILLCTEKNNVQVEFATSGMSNKMFISKYQLYLPTKEELEKEIRKLL